MHPKNRYNEKHDFVALVNLVPKIEEYLFSTPDGRTSLDFTNPEAVYLLNKALLLRDYGLKHWDIPRGSLTPPVPGRLDYIHLLADLLEGEKDIHILDVGTGASLIYPILGVGEYGWKFTGSEINARSLRVAEAIIKFNPGLSKKVRLRSPEVGKIFRGVVGVGEQYSATMCNPPFFASKEAALAAARKKWEKLGHDDLSLSFGGQDHELWTEGGEPAFLKQYISEGKEFANQVGWFTTLVSKVGYLKIANQELERHGATEIKTLALNQGNKIGRVLAWKF